MILGGSSGESCTKHSEGCSSGTSSPHSDPNQSYSAQSKQTQHAYPQYPPVPSNWTDFLPPPPEHPPPLPANNCNPNMAMCHGPTSPTAIRRTAQRAPSGMSNHPGYVFHITFCIRLNFIFRHFINESFSKFVFRMLAASQCSSQGGLSCGGNSAGYSPWGPPAPHQYVPPNENFYNNPYSASNGNSHRYPITPNGQQPPVPVPGPYFHQTPAGRSLHNHYPTSHPHATEYQPYPANGRKCNGRYVSNMKPNQIALRQNY